MKEQEQNKFDTYMIGGIKYIKDIQLGPRAWKAIDSSSPGRFVDILESKFNEAGLIQKIDINK